MKHFAEGKFKKQTKLLPEKIYVYVRDYIARGSVEALVMNKKRTKVLLGKRIIWPWPNWWTFGSRMKAGESPAEAVSRTVREDIGLKIFPGRFIFLDTMSLVWSKRQEPPQKDGCHDLALFHLLLIDERESLSIRLRAAEYEKTEWFDPKDVAVKAGFHPSTVECLKQALKI
ncbi:MAG: NUDIX domain-containing protein [Candidatus Wildermuthbacteria bacterium]|nr:NUDIX domain-containing protein [Candidatus Wildermuthbacteria bacterium]